MIDTLSHFQEFSLRFPRLPDFLRVSLKDWKVEGGEGNLGFLRLDFFLPPFSKTGLSHLHSQISYYLKVKTWKHSFLCVLELGKIGQRGIVFFFSQTIHKSEIEIMFAKQVQCCLELVKYEEFILDKKLSNIFQDHLSQEGNTYIYNFTATRRA